MEYIMSENKEERNNNEVLEFLRNLDERLLKVESKLGLATYNLESEQKNETNDKFSEPNSIESSLGEYWFANLGILILTVSVILLLTSSFSNLPSIIPSAIGLVFTGATLFLSKILSNNYKYVSNYLYGTGLILLFFSAVRLFHFGAEPIIENILFKATVLLAVVILSLFLSIKRNSPYIAGLSLTLGCVTGLIIGNGYFIFFLTAAISAIFVYLYIKNNWQFFLLYGMLVCYLTHFIWAINNPLLNETIKVVTIPHFNLFFIVLYAVIFALGDILNTFIANENTISISNSIINVLTSFLLFQFICLNTEKSVIIYYELLFFIITFFISIIFWLNQKGKYSTSSYALISYMALSAAIISFTTIPNMFILLIWQSILVTITSLWYKSKAITVTNFLIFLSLFIVYLFTTGEFTIISLSFGIVALISARILNWQKKRLTLKTELMRNTYLGIAFFSIPFTLLKSLPDQFIAFSWLAVAIVYYVLSILLRNFKYRWMGHLTLVATIMFVFLFGLSHLDPTYKITTLASIGVVAFAVSILFTKFRLKLSSNQMQIHKP